MRSAVEVRGNETGVRLLRGRERILDADVELLRTRAKPAAAAGAQLLRLRQLLHPEQAAVERARRVLAARRRRDLHVIDARDGHLRSFTIGSVAAQLEDTLVGGYRRLAAEAPRRRIDIELRLLDILFASVFGLILLPVGLVIAAVILVTCGRPVLYKGERVGRGAHFFAMLKFRTLETGRRDAASGRTSARSSCAGRRRSTRGSAAG